MRELVAQLTIIANALSQKDYLSVIIPWALGLISSIGGALIGYFISSRQEKQRFIRESHIEYMKLTNDFLSEINSIITSMVNIQKMGFLLIGDQNDPDKYSPYFYGDLSNYYLVLNKIRELRKYVETIDINTEKYSSKKHYKDQIINLSDDIMNFNKFVLICSKYEKQAVNYFYFIDKKLRIEHANIINEISNATKQNMNEFDIEELKKQIVLHIQNINGKILRKKITEKNLFNQIEENNKKKDA